MEINRSIYLKLFCAFCLMTSCINRDQKERNVKFIIAADLHFDFLPETDQYHHVVAMNKLKDVDGVIIAGDIFDKAHPEILELYRRRYEKDYGTEGDKTIRFNVFPGYGNHDIDPQSSDSLANISGRKFNLAYLDSILKEKLEKKEILNLHSSSRSYSWNEDDVHFIQGQRYSGDTSYCESNLKWLAEDLKKYASNGNPVVYIQHYGFDQWALNWWSEEDRRNLFNLLDSYNLVAFFVGHTHESSIQYYGNHKIYQVNNAWPDDDGLGSFDIFEMKGNCVKVSICRWSDKKGLGNTDILAF